MNKREWIRGVDKWNSSSSRREKIRIIQYGNMRDMDKKGPSRARANIWLLPRLSSCIFADLIHCVGIRRLRTWRCRAMRTVSILRGDICWQDTASNGFPTSFWCLAVAKVLNWALQLLYFNNCKAVRVIPLLIIDDHCGMMRCTHAVRRMNCPVTMLLTRAVLVKTVTTEEW